MHSLSFQVKNSPIDETDTVAAEIYPRVNGVPLLDIDGNYMFDSGVTAQLGVQNAMFSPFTCSCGDAACAGIHEQVSMEVENGVVTWRFPEEPFRHTLNQKLFPEGQPLILKFDLAQYEENIKQLSSATV